MRLTIPLIDEDEIEEVRNVLSSGYLTQGQKVAEFEQMVANLVGSRYAFAMSSCTTALHLSLYVLGIGPRDEVLVPDFTFPATANVVVHLGATPVLVDIELNTFTLDIDDLRSKVSERTKAIMPVHAFGCSADMEPILEIAKDYDLPVVEDAATAIGATYYGRYCGNLATLGCFSFHPRKVVTTGEGGMIITNDDFLAERIKLLRSHGGVGDGYWYRYEDAGFNYRLSDIHGAIGVAQMNKLPKIIERRRELTHQLRKRLAEVNGICVPHDPPWGGHIYQSFVILIEETLDRDRIIHELRSRDIEATLGTYALHEQPFYQRKYDYFSGDLPRSQEAFFHTITLPLYPQMSNDDIDFIAVNLREVVDAQAGT